MNKMRQTIEDFENNARPEWNREANWAKIESSIKASKKSSKSWLMLLLALAVFGTGYSLSYYIHQENFKSSTPLDTKIQRDTIQVIAQVRDTIVYYRKEYVYQHDTVFIEKKIEPEPVTVSEGLENNKKIVEMPEMYIPIPDSQYKLPDFRLTRAGKRTSKSYATNVFFDDTTHVTRSEFRIFHRIEGKGMGHEFGRTIVLIK